MREFFKKVIFNLIYQSYFGLLSTVYHSIQMLMSIFSVWLTLLQLPMFVDVAMKKMI